MNRHFQSPLGYKCWRKDIKMKLNKLQIIYHQNIPGVWWGLVPGQTSIFLICFHQLTFVNAIIIGIICIDFQVKFISKVAISNHRRKMSYWIISGDYLGIHLYEAKREILLEWIQWINWVFYFSVPGAITICLCSWVENFDLE